MTSPTENSIPNLPNFLVETRRLGEWFERLNSSLDESGGELWHLTKMSKHTFCGILLKKSEFCFWAIILEPETLESRTRL